MAKRRLLWLILGVALVLRLLFVLGQDPLAPYLVQSSDSRWYLGNAYPLVTGRTPDDLLTATARFAAPHHLTDFRGLVTGQFPGTLVTDVSRLASPPLYFVVIGVPQMLLDPAAAVIAIRVFQVLLSSATCYFAYRLALLLTGRESAGLLAAGVLALSPAFIVETGQILTETVYIFLVTGGVWLYVESLKVVGGRSTAVPHFLAAVCLGLAALTRAVLLAFPFALALFLPFVLGWRKGWRRATLLLLVYALVVSTWTIYSVVRWNRFVIAGEGLPAFLYIGASETGWTSPQQVDQSLADQSPNGSYIEGAQSVISSDPLGWIEHRLTELAGATLQPHGTTFYPGESLRDLALGWLRGSRSLSELVQGDAFLPKLALYVLHYTALIAGLAGMWLYRRRWQIALPMIGFIGYITLVHLALYALPRYLFPNEVFWWVFAAAALTHGFSARARNKRIES